MNVEEAKRLRIEKEFSMHRDKKGNWIPNLVVMSPKEIRRIQIKPSDLSKIVLFVNKDKSTLKGKNILRIIKNGERRGFNERPSCASRNRWYELERRIPSTILYPMIHHDRQTVGYNKQRFQVDHNLFEIFPHNKKAELQILAFLLSTVSMMFREFAGRVNLGEGALKTEGIDIKKLPVANFMRGSIDKKIRKYFKEFSESSIQSIFIELRGSQNGDVSLNRIARYRRELDKIIMGDILGLSEIEQLEVYKAVIDLVSSRISKAKTVEGKKKTKEGIDVEEVKRLILKKDG